ncbi:MAG: TIGR01777 family oxidoreductase [bacterium]|nr:TIGR01777 family oxidoreductase [bacterium]
MEKVIVVGANGFIGRHLVPTLAEKYEVVALTRRPESFDKARNVLWDGKTVGDWIEELEGAYAVINLSGKSVNCRHNEKNKAAILNSRVDTTEAVGQAIESCENLPKVWLNSSGVSIYKESYETPQDESATEFDDDFLAEVTKKWEASCMKYAKDCRKVTMRTSVILGLEDGSYPLIAKLTKLYAGGKQGSGKQYFPWMHVNDFCMVVRDTLLVKDEISGPVNMCAPDLVTNAEFMAEMRRAHNRSFGIPAPAFLLKIASAIIGTEASLVLKSSYVDPKVLKENDAVFAFPKIGEAIDDLASR